MYPPPSANVPKPGGFTITSPPSRAAFSPSNPHPYLELAIQSSPSNPAAAYLFRPTAELLHTTVDVRVGGSFEFPPPPHIDKEIRLEDGQLGIGRGIVLASPLLVRKVVLVAGGMGINPLMSMLSFIGEQEEEEGGECWRDKVEVRVLYSVQDPGGGGSGDGDRDGAGILFLERIVDLFENGKVRGGLRLFLTGGGSASAREGGDAEREVVRCSSSGVDVPFLKRRVTISDVEEAVGEDKETTVVYVCGVPTMTDEFVEALVSPEGLGMEEDRVKFEKWW